VVSGILLAAGRSLRFGGDKLLHPLADGTPMAAAALRALQAAVSDVVAVVRDSDSQLAALLAREGARVVPCPRADRGLGASLAWGVTRAPDGNGWVIALADMPFVRTETIVEVVRALESGAAIAAPFFQSRRGHPVGFAAAFGDELRTLDGDEGARALLQRHAAQLARVEVDDPGVLRDVDTPQDLAD